jgi:ribose 5-phosphate isomerase B
LRVVLGGDHRGYQLKDVLADYLRARGHDITDVGTNGPESVDYPDVTLAAVRPVATGAADRAIVICGSGVGACIAANKVPGIRAAMTHDTYSAHQGVEHDDMNVICIGSRIIGEDLAKEIVDAFLAARFNTTEERYQRRLDKLKAIEAGQQEEERV